MSIDLSKKLEPYKGIKKKNDELFNKIFVELQYNKKVPKYNYNSGLFAGMLLDKLAILQPILEANKKIDNDLAMKILEQIIPLVRELVERYNWKLGNLKDIVQQVFGES